MEECNPWSRGVQSLERILGSHDSMKKGVILTEGKDEREEVMVSVGLKSRAEIEARARARSTTRVRVEEQVVN